MGCLPTFLPELTFPRRQCSRAHTFQGGDLGWRKLSDIPSMFADILPSLKAGDTGKVQSNSGLHLVHLAEARGLERLVEQTNVRHILVTPNEVLDDEAARNFVLASKSESIAEKTLPISLKSIRTTSDRRRKAVNSDGPIQVRWFPNLRLPWQAPKSAW